MIRRLKAVLPESLLRRVDTLARETRRSRSAVIRDAVVSFIEDDDDAKIALARLNDPGDPVISGGMLRKRLGL